MFGIVVVGRSVSEQHRNTRSAARTKTLERLLQQLGSSTITMGGSGGGHAACDLRKCNRLLGLVSFFAAVGGFLFGYDLALIGGALLYIEDDLGIGEDQVEIIVAGTKIGAVFGTFLGGWLMQQFGRRVALTTVTAFFILGPITMAVAETSGVLAFGRVLAGLGVGASAVVCPAYTAEMAPPSLRGAMVSMYEIMLCAGMFVAVICDYALAPLPLGTNWRWMVGLPALFACVQLLIPCLLPESPHWLVSKGKLDEGLKVLRAIYDTKEDVEKDETSEMAERELLSVWSSFEKAKRDDAQMWFEQSARCCNGCACLRGCECIRNLFRRLAAVSVELWSGVERRATRLIMIMALIDQLCASTAIINYAPTIIVSLQNRDSFYNGTNMTSGLCMPCGGTRDDPTGFCGQWGYGEDPWVPVTYAASSEGTTSGQVRTVTGFGLDIDAGVSLFTTEASIEDGPYNAYGRAIVVHASNGDRIGCGCCAGSGDEVTGSSVISIERYPDYTGSLDVSGVIAVSVPEDIGGRVRLTYDLDGLEADAVGGLHIHTGTSCAIASEVGGHLYAVTEADDPGRVLQVCSKLQGYCTPADNSDCICQSIEADELCNVSLAPDPWTDCHYCDNATAALEDAAEAVGESAAIAAAKLIGMIIAIVLIDSKYGGRRPLLIYGSFAMGAGMIMLTVAVSIESLGFALFSMAVFILAFSASWAGGFWVIVSEVFTMRTKAIAAPIATAVLFAAGALANITFLSAYNGMGAGCFVIYAVISFAGGMYLQVYLPETKGKTLSEVQAIMQDARNNSHGHFGYVCGCWPCCPEFVPRGKVTTADNAITFATASQDSAAGVNVAKPVRSGAGYQIESDSDSDNVYEDAEVAASVARDKREKRALQNNKNAGADYIVVEPAHGDDDFSDSSDEGSAGVEVIEVVEPEKPKTTPPPVRRSEKPKLQADRPPSTRSDAAVEGDESSLDGPNSGTAAGGDDPAKTNEDSFNVDVAQDSDEEDSASNHSRTESDVDESEAQ